MYLKNHEADADQDIWSCNMVYLFNCAKWLCLLKIIFLFNQMTVKIDTHKINWIKLKEKISCKVALVRNTIQILFFLK